MSSMYCKYCGVGNISRHYWLGHGSVPYWPFVFLNMEKKSTKRYIFFGISKCFWGRLCGWLSGCFNNCLCGCFCDRLCVLLCSGIDVIIIVYQTLTVKIPFRFKFYLPIFTLSGNVGCPFVCLSVFVCLCVSPIVGGKTMMVMVMVMVMVIVMVMVMVMVMLQYSGNMQC